MSGGTWDYKQRIVEDLLNQISKETKIEFPNLSGFTKDLARILSVYIDELDKHYAGDTEIEDKSLFEEEFINDIYKKTMDY
jgi:hypothetical protein